MEIVDPLSTCQGFIWVFLPQEVHLLGYNCRDWVASMNLTDAYLHIPINPRSRTFMRFTHIVSSVPIPQHLESSLS